MLRIFPSYLQFNAKAISIAVVHRSWQKQHTMDDLMDAQGLRSLMEWGSFDLQYWMLPLVATPLLIVLVVVASYLLRVPEMGHLGGCWYSKSNEFVKMR